MNTVRTVNDILGDRYPFWQIDIFWQKDIYLCKKDIFLPKHDWRSAMYVCDSLLLLFFPDLKCWYGICAKCQVLHILATKMSLLEGVSPLDETPKIERHINSVHEKEKPYYSSDHQNIEKFHEVINAFKCKICEYKTGRKSDLKRHIESVHEGIKNFNCNICDYKSSINYY